jgi:heterodisulfide reductase subunit A-like polyferredoxin
MTLTRWCGACAADVTFARFDCREHPEECVELVCAGCGEGFELGPVQAVEETGVRVTSAA